MFRNETKNWQKLTGETSVSVLCFEYLHIGLNPHLIHIQKFLKIKI